MPAPVISVASSILGFRRREPWQFQPGATNSPTSWGLSAVPAEISINTSTGLITCTGIDVTGPIVFTVTATNGNRASSREFVAGISPEVFIASDSAAEAAAEWTFDLVTRKLAALRESESADQSGFLAYWKQDDKFLLRFRMTKNGTPVDPDPTVLKLITTADDEEPSLSVASEFERSVATGAEAYFDLLVDLSTGPLKAAITDEEDSNPITRLEALIQLQMEYSVDFGVATTMRLTSRTSKVELARDFVL